MTTSSSQGRVSEKPAAQSLSNTKVLQIKQSPLGTSHHGLGTMGDQVSYNQVSLTQKSFTEKLVFKCEEVKEY